LTPKAEKVEVQIKYKDLQQSFSAPPEETWFLLSKFFNQFLPSFEIVNRLKLSVDLEALAKDCEGLVGFSEEGLNLLVPKNKLTDNETLLLLLLASYLGKKLGLMEKLTLPRELLQAKLGKNGKITSTRLGELAKNDLISKTSGDEYHITTFGIIQMQKEIIPKIKAKND